MLFLFISCCSWQFFFFFFLIPGDFEYASLKYALVIPTGAPIAVANDAVKRLPLVLDKTIKYLSKKMQHIY